MPLPLFHRDLGGAGRPALVILHGMLGSSRNWQTAGRELSAGYHVFALDLRNHGNSPQAAEMDYEAMAGDVAAWLDARGLGRVAILGHSMGGKVAMLFSCRRPERVERLVVIDIAPKDYHWPAHREEFAAMNELDLGLLRSRADAERGFAAKVPDPFLRKFLATNLERTEAGGWRWLVNLPVLTAALPVLEKNPLLPGDQFAGPALFVTGGKSSYVRPDDWSGIVGHFPAARLEVMPASGHNLHLDSREALVRIVKGSRADF